MSILFLQYMYNVDLYTKPISVSIPKQEKQKADQTHSGNDWVPSDVHDSSETP